MNYTITDGGIVFEIDETHDPIPDAEAVRAVMTVAAKIREDLLKCTQTIPDTPITTTD